MKRILEIDDIKVGMYITILKGEIREKVLFAPIGPITLNKENTYLNGAVLEVLVIDMPYIVVNTHAPIGKVKHHIDLRKVKIMLLSYEYVKSLCPEIKFSKDFFGNSK